MAMELLRMPPENFPKFIRSECISVPLIDFHKPIRAHFAVFPLALLETFSRAKGES